MMKYMTAGAALLLTTTAAGAVGLDRSGQAIGALFEDGENYVELSFGVVNPSIVGNDVAAFGAGSTGNVADDFTNVGFAYKYQITEEFSAALIIDQPYGVDIDYPVGSSVALGGTIAKLDTEAVSLIGRYEFGNGFSVHAGFRYQTIDADVSLSGAAYGPLSGYSLSLEDSSEFGYLIGAAYERPDIALRIALTYFGEVDHTFDTTENIVPGVTTRTNVTTPEAWNLDFQTGIAADTLLFGSIRYVDYSTVILSPTGFAGATGGASLTDIDAGTTYSLGVGRRFNDAISGFVTAGYDTSGSDSLVSPLAPTNGSYSVGIGGAYDFGNGVELSGGVRYTRIGDASAETADTARAEFNDSDAVAFGLKVAYTF